MADDQKRSESSSSFHAVIDRIEDNEIAVIKLGDDEDEQIDLPLSYLPKEASEGDHLRITIKIDAESHAAAEDEIRGLQEKLLKRSGGTKG